MGRSPAPPPKKKKRGGGGGGGGVSHEWSGKKLSSLQKAPFNLNDKTGAVIGGFIKNGSTLAAERDRIPNKPLKYPSEVLVSDFTT